MPDWAKPGTNQNAPLVERFGDRQDDRPARGGDRRDRRPDARPRGAGRPGGRSDNRGGGGRGDQRGGGRGDQRGDRRDDRRPIEPPEPVLAGWKATILPDPRGIEGLAKQLKSSGKAYPLFDLAVLILEKTERYSVVFHPEAGATPLTRLESDGSLWVSEAAAIRHVLDHQLEKFYRREVTQGEPPKGSFSFIAICGMSDTVLGPPNFHDYQTRLHRLHAEKFARMPFEAFKSRVRMVKEPEVLEKWKSDQSTREEFFALDSAEGAEPVKLADRAAVERHFRAQLSQGMLVAVTGEVEVHGPVAIHHCDTVVRQLAQNAVLDLRRFPLPLAHVLGQSLSTKGLQVFKAHENITYISVARPRYLDRVNTPVADGIAGILDHLESAPSGQPRPEQWKALLALRVTPEDATAKEAALVGDLSWLIHQGHVIDYAKRGLEAVRKPKPRLEHPEKAAKKSGKPRQPERSEKSLPVAASPQASAAVSTASPTASEAASSAAAASPDKPAPQVEESPISHDTTLPASDDSPVSNSETPQ